MLILKTNEQLNMTTAVRVHQHNHTWSGESNQHQQFHTHHDIVHNNFKNIYYAQHITPNHLLIHNTRANYYS